MDPDTQVVPPEPAEAETEAPAARRRNTAGKKGKGKSKKANQSSQPMMMMPPPGYMFPPYGYVPLQSSVPPPAPSPRAEEAAAEEHHYAESEDSDDEYTLYSRKERKLLREAEEEVEAEQDSRSKFLDEDILMLDEMKLALMKIKHSDVGQAIFTLSPKVEQWTFLLLLAFWEVAMLVIYAVWFDYVPSSEAAADNFFYPYFRDVAVMIFFGFGLLMVFIRRNGFSAVGYTVLFSALAVQWSVLLGHIIQKGTSQFESRQPVTILDLLNGLFCAAAVMITYGGSLGKIMPIQLLLITFVEPVLYWLNFYIGVYHLHAHDVGGGMWIHTFGCYFGLPIAWFLTTRGTKNHPDAVSGYMSDVLSLTGSIFLWIMWPSFNAAVAEAAHDGRYGSDYAQNVAVVNTVLALTGATIATFVFSPLSLHAKFDVVHLANATLAGGVVMGTAADLEMYPATAMGCGFAAGAISVLGYRFLTPFLTKWVFLQDVCGINNLHGMPGVLGALLAVFLTAGICDKHPGECYHGESQAAYQLAALAITLGIAVGGGIVTGFLCFLLKIAMPLKTVNHFNDRQFWEVASDYSAVVAPAEERPGYWQERRMKLQDKASKVLSKLKEATKEAAKKAREEKKAKNAADPEADFEMDELPKKSSKKRDSSRSMKKSKPQLTDSESMSSDHDGVV